MRIAPHSMVERKESGCVRGDLKEVVAGGENSSTRLDESGMALVEGQVRYRHAGSDRHLEALVVAVGQFDDDGKRAVPWPSDWSRGG